MKDFVKTLIME